VGVYRRKNKWLAGLQYGGKYYHLGLFDDEVEAAKARDRKAYELLGAYAYLNFPEDFPQRRGPVKGLTASQRVYGGFRAENRVAAANFASLRWPLRGDP
jgi:hypothetical protein